MCTGMERNKSSLGEAMSLDFDLIKGLKFIDPHIHMFSRTTDAYQAM